MDQIINNIRSCRSRLSYIRKNINLIKEAQVQDVLSREVLDTSDYLENDLRAEIKIRNMISDTEAIKCSKY